MTGNTNNPAQVFEDYFGPSIFQPWAELLIDAAKPEAGEHVLDLACATGTVARMIAPQVGLQGAAAGLDFSAMMLSVARAAPTYGGPPIEWTEGDAANLPYADESFDLVTSQQGLQFFPDRSRSAHEIHRVLKPGGRLVAAVWQGTDVHPIFRSLFDLVAQRLDVPFDAVALPFSLGSADELEAYVKLGGFDHVDVTPRELELEFRSPSRFAQLSVAGAAAAIPAFGEMDAEMRAAVGEDVSQELAPTLEPHVVGDILKMNTAVNIAIAIK